jgi:hypothetical protein
MLLSNRRSSAAQVSQLTTVKNRSVSEPLGRPRTDNKGTFQPSAGKSGALVLVTFLLGSKSDLDRTSLNPPLFPLRLRGPSIDADSVSCCSGSRVHAATWSGNLRLSLVLIPVKLHSAVSTEKAISFRMIHQPSGKPIRYVKGIPTEQGFEEVPEEEIVKGYEHAKGHHVLIKPEELDDLKLKAKHTIDMVRFVDEAEIDTRYLEKPYYLTPDGDEADEG